ncbi:unnamed protein product [Clavelina lepadiformis]|uniref:NXPE C-terminal domain-containing protein n=1 Tax=Clavelina lepadiformis TaxID=159417 RepID=A0ABP0FGA4_CLALP
MTSLEKYKLENPTQNPEKFTRITSTISVETNTTRFETGDTVVVHIQAKDRLNRNKTFGGDYFRARLIRKTADGKLTDGIACSIKDHLNGSYTLQVPLLMAGTFTLEVKLVLPVEGIAWFINFTSMRNNKGISYEATLNTKETVECNLDLNTYEGRENKLMCDYGNPRNGEPWFCDLPPSGNCSPITWMISRDISRAKFPKQFGEVAQIAGSGMQIKVLNGTYNRRESASNIPLVYLHKEKWVKALRSKIVSFKEDFRKCLENKPFYMFGDSTIRQFFHEFARIFDLKVHGPDNSGIWQNPKIGRSENSSSNIIVYYRGHGPPFRNPGPPSSRPYITDSIHAINVQNVTQNYVLLHLGLHPILHEPSFYLRRLLSIKKEMIRHHRSVPNTIFVVKGMNVVEWGEEWLIWRYERLLREMFKNMSNVFYLDLWDLTIVTPIQTYHPTQPVLEQQVLLLLDLVCSK